MRPGRGRKPKSIDEHILKGTFRSDRHGGNTLRLPLRVPNCPKDLPEAAKVVWREVAKLLKGKGVLTPADLWCMRRFCTAIARLHAAEAEYDKLPAGSSLTELGRNAKKSLYVVIRGETDTAQKYGAALGLDPPSRTRLQVGVTDTGPAPPEVRGADLDLPPPGEEVG